VQQLAPDLVWPFVPPARPPACLPARPPACPPACLPACLVLQHDTMTLCCLALGTEGGMHTSRYVQAEGFSPPAFCLLQVITFDSYGVSGHPNHRATYRGVAAFLLQHRSLPDPRPLEVQVLVGMGAQLSSATSCRWLPCLSSAGMAQRLCCCITERSCVALCCVVHAGVNLPS
jgi:hypothetical protein